MKFVSSPVFTGKKRKGSSTQVSAETGAKEAKEKSLPMSAFSATAQTELRGVFTNGYCSAWSSSCRAVSIHMSGFQFC